MTTAGQKQTWANFNTKLRQHAAISNTMQITTFTYDPVIGLTSQTDTNGIAGYYEYDASGRLRVIRDNDENIISTHEYHYKGQGN
jgi:YD repeat-containing protein